MSNFFVTIKPTKENLVEYYTTALYPPIEMFVKWAVKLMMIENYDEANRVEVDLDSKTKHTSEPEVKSTVGK